MSARLDGDLDERPSDGSIGTWRDAVDAPAVLASLRRTLGDAARGCATSRRSLDASGCRRCAAAHPSYRRDTDGATMNRRISDQARRRVRACSSSSSRRSRSTRSGGSDAARERRRPRLVDGRDRLLGARPSSCGCGAAKMRSTATSTTTSCPPPRRPACTLVRVPIDDTAAALARIALGARRRSPLGRRGRSAVGERQELRPGQRRRAVVDRLGRPPAERAVPRPDRRDAAQRFRCADRRPGGSVEPRRVRASRTTPRRSPIRRRDFDALAAYVRAHPGRVTYPAPPDFTGSAFVRQAVQALGEDRRSRCWPRCDPTCGNGGASYPKDQPELERLFASRPDRPRDELQPELRRDRRRARRVRADRAAVRVRDRHAAERELPGDPVERVEPRRRPGRRRPDAVAGAAGREARAGRHPDGARRRIASSTRRTSRRPALAVPPRCASARRSRSSLRRAYPSSTGAGETRCCDSRPRSLLTSASAPTTESVLRDAIARVADGSLCAVDRAVGRRQDDAAASRRRPGGPRRGTCSARRHRRHSPSPAHRRGVAMLFQEPRLFDSMSVLDNVAYADTGARRATRGRRHATSGGAARRGRPRRIAPTSRPVGLSGGERQRVALARALTASPRGAAARRTAQRARRAAARRDLASVIDRMRRARRLTTLYVSHDLADAVALADRLAVMIDGEVVQHDTPTRGPRSSSVARRRAAHRQPERARRRVDGVHRPPRTRRARRARRRPAAVIARRPSRDPRPGAPR